MDIPLALLWFLACRSERPERDTDPGEPPQAAVAVWKGGSVDWSDLDAAAGDDLRSLEIDYRLRRHQLLERHLRDLTDDRLLAEEAGRRDMTVDALLDAEVDQKVPTSPIVDSEAFARELHNRKLSDRYDVFLAQLRDGADLDVELPWPDLPRVDVAVSAQSPVRGPKDARVTLVWFGDFQCPYTARVAPTLLSIVDAHPDVRLVWEDFPLNGHDRALPAAIAARCVAEQGHFWEMLSAIFAHQSSLDDDDLALLAVDAGAAEAPFRACIASGRGGALVARDREAGRAAGVAATPTVFVDGITVPGARGERDFEGLVARELLR
jgi:protein-disulfide isomerase